jgi:mannose-6-phosphate isomerase-like protein (cupin superfamily)
LAGKPDHIDNPITGERITFLQRSEDTDGKLLNVRITMPPTGKGPPGHRHRNVTEVYTVQSGVLTIMAGNRKNTKGYGPGESVEVTPYTAHRFRNHGPEVAEVDLKVYPASDFEDHLHAAFGLARDGRTTKHGMPKNPLDLALLFELSDTFLLGMPMFFQSAVFSPLAALARKRGYSPVFAQYSRFEHDHGDGHGHE